MLRPGSAGNFIKATKKVLNKTQDTRLAFDDQGCGSEKPITNSTLLSINSVSLLQANQKIKNMPVIKSNPEIFWHI